MVATLEIRASYSGIRLTRFRSARVVYRGEVGRIMVWRRRLDLTTTWVITGTTTIITVAFSFRDIPHVIFFSICSPSG